MKHKPFKNTLENVKLLPYYIWLYLLDFLSWNLLAIYLTNARCKNISNLRAFM